MQLFSSFSFSSVYLFIFWQRHPLSRWRIYLRFITAFHDSFQGIFVMELFTLPKFMAFEDLPKMLYVISKKYRKMLEVFDKALKMKAFYLNNFIICYLLIFQRILYANRRCYQTFGSIYDGGDGNRSSGRILSTRYNNEANSMTS